jgi:hypothetical protein
MNLNKFIGAGVALAGSTLVLGSTLSAAPAQAYTLTEGSTIDITGSGQLLNAGVLNPVSDVILLAQSAVTKTTGGFSDITGLVTTSNINLNTKLSTDAFGSIYSSSAVTNPLFSFAGGLKFFVDNPFNVTRSTNGAVVFIERFTGTFVGNGSATAKGILTLQEFGNGGSYSATVAVAPEPLTILGTATALGFGAFLKSAKKKKQDQEIA